MKLRGERATSPGILSEKFGSNQSINGGKKSGLDTSKLKNFSDNKKIAAAAGRKSVTPQRSFRIMSEREKKKLERKFEGTELNEEKL